MSIKFNHKGRIRHHLFLGNVVAATMGFPIFDLQFYIEIIFEYSLFSLEFVFERRRWIKTKKTRRIKITAWLRCNNDEKENASNTWIQPFLFKKKGERMGRWLNAICIQSIDVYLSASVVMASYFWSPKRVTHHSSRRQRKQSNHFENTKHETIPSYEKKSQWREK